MKRRQIYTWATVLLFILTGVEQATAGYVIPSDTTIGTWDPATRTYTLKKDVDDTIEVVESALTLDGAGHTVTGPGTEYGYGVYFIYHDGLTIKNLNVEAFERGFYFSGDNNTLTGNTVSNNYYGFCFGGRHNTLTGNTALNNKYGIYIGGLKTFAYNVLTGNTVSNNKYGICIGLSFYNQIYNNNFIDNVTQASIEEPLGNIFNLDKPIGGNYWNNWTTPDADEDGFVDSPYVFTPGQDDIPWVRQNGWIAARTEQLIDQVEGMDLQQEIEKSLLARLKSVLNILDHLTKDNDVAAIKSLEAFIKGVEVQRGKKIQEDDADALIAAAQQIIDLLGSG